jgi:hydrogenase expression/formation protein HypC
LEEEFGDAWEQAAKEAGDTVARERAAAEPQDSGSEAR